MTFVLLDTNVISYLLKPKHPLYEECIAATEGQYWCISFMTRAELMAWPGRRKWGEMKRQELENLVSACATLYPDEETCSLWAKIVRQSESMGRSIAFADAWIAAAAIQFRIPLITADYRDFDHLSDLEIFEIS